jgi:allophanate hydrolase
MQTIDLNPDALQRAYFRGDLTPRQVLEEVDRRCHARQDNPLWIYRLSAAEREPYLEALEDKSPEDLPLYGIPFAIKDNIDLADIPTTAGCAEFTYTPAVSATAVARLIAAGAIPIGKTNLDQFATGLNGTRSPWGAVRNAFNPAFISGGSSSGSAAAVALNLVSFALGTDTAGSGRVPAALNQLVGLKPTKGLVSAAGVVPACRSLDCVTVFSQSVDTAARVLELIAGPDAKDPYSRRSRIPVKAGNPQALRIGVPKAEQLAFFGSERAALCFAQARQRWETLGATIVEVDFSPFLEAATLLYAGPWVAERYAAIEAFIQTRADALLPVIREIIEPAGRFSAVDCFKAEYRLKELKQKADVVLDDVDLIMSPTIGRAYTIAEVQADPVRLNTELGYYTNFMNLLDYSAIAVPAGSVDYAETGRPAGQVPWGVTLFATAFADSLLLRAASAFCRATDNLMPATKKQEESGVLERLRQKENIDVVVCGAHLSGMPLNWQLLERGAVLKQSTMTAPSYRFYALAGGPPFRPGLVRDTTGGQPIKVEVWSLPIQHLGSFIRLIPHPLGLGRVELADGSWQTSFICEPCGLEGARDITQIGCWREFIRTL